MHKKPANKFNTGNGKFLPVAFFSVVFDIVSKALSLIHEHKYQGALDYLKDKGEGIFKNGDVSINNAIREYCINQLS